MTLKRFFKSVTVEHTKDGKTETVPFDEASGIEQYIVATMIMKTAEELAKKLPDTGESMKET